MYQLHKKAKICVFAGESFIIMHVLPVAICVHMQNSSDLRIQGPKQNNHAALNIIPSTAVACRTCAGHTKTTDDGQDTHLKDKKLFQAAPKRRQSYN